MKLRGFALTVAALAATAAFAATGAAGNGGPSPGTVAGWDGVVAPAGDVRYVAVPSGDRTVVAAVRVRGGRVVRWTSLPGQYGIPMVAYDGTTGGLSPDGKTLVIATQLTAGARETRFALLNTRTFRRARTIVLRGAFSYDAFAPGGRTLYLIEHVTPARDAARYVVRAYDLRKNRLVPRKVADKRTRQTTMRGVPLTRATTRVGTWIYTLYGGGHHASVHALNTRGRWAVSVNLPWRGEQQGLWSVRMSLRSEGRHLLLRQPGIGKLALVDTQSFSVRVFRKPVRPGTQSMR